MNSYQFHAKVLRAKLYFTLKFRFAKLKREPKVSEAKCGNQLSVISYHENIGKNAL